MRHLYNFGRILILISITWSTFGITGHEGPRTRIERTITREFNTGSEPLIHLESQKGQIKFRTWNENRVTIRITIASEADSKSKAESGLDMVNVITEQTSNTMYIKTDFDDQNTGNSFWNLIRFWEDDHKLTVDMVINVPVNSTFNLTHKYGDLILPGIQSAKVEIQYGSMNSGQIREHLDLVARYSHGTLGDLASGNILLQYSDFDFGDMESGNINVQYSKFRANNSKVISMDSKYSSVGIDSVGDFNLNGKFDKIKIEDSDNVKIYTKYTALDIGTVRSHADVTNSYQSTKIRYILPGFQNVQVVGRYGDLVLGFEGLPDADFELETKYGKIRIPENATVISRNESNSIHFVKGCLGECHRPVTVTNSYGNITLEFN